MASASRRSPLSGGTQHHHQSLFYRDLASPSSLSPSSAPRSSKFVTPGQAAAVSALWRHNFPASTDLPPPPFFTLEDRADFSPDAPPGELPPPPSPTPLPSFRTPSRSNSRGKAPPATPSAPGGTSNPQTPSSATWWSPAKEDGHRSAKEGSPVDGVVEPGALVVLPPPREVVRPEAPPRATAPVGALDEEEWVTVYGFSPADTNLVLREFEKCGSVLHHVLGPKDANWMHVLYQNRYDAQKALQKNGVQLNSVLIVGVKPVDPMQRQFLEEKLSSTNKGFMVSLPPPPLVNGRSTGAAGQLKPSPSILQAPGGGSISDSGWRTDGAIATPAKSIFSKAMDLMFGL